MVIVEQVAHKMPEISVGSLWIFFLMVLAFEMPLLNLSI